MHIIQTIIRPMSGFMALMILWLGLSLQVASAAMIGTETVHNHVYEQGARERIDNFLGRQDVQAKMEAWGIDPMEARARADSLSDAEIADMAAKLDQLPAGGVDAVIIALLSIFAILVITDLLGITNIFTFIIPRR